jgi:hypothetical protein
MDRMANCCIGGSWFTLAQFLGFIIVVSQELKELVVIDDRGSQFFLKKSNESPQNQSFL